MLQTGTGHLRAHQIDGSQSGQPGDVRQTGIRDGTLHQIQFFQLMQMPEGISGEMITSLLLLRHGVYVRSCSDKIGLNGEFIRVAIRTESENERVLTALAEILG